MDEEFDSEFERELQAAREERYWERLNEWWSE